MRERGSITFWLLGLAFALLTLGVLSVDLWNLVAERRELASLADASALAATAAIDESRWRSDRHLVLDRDDATRRVIAMLEAHGATDLDWRISFGPDAASVRVVLTRTVDAALLGLAGRDAVTVGASSEATATVHD